MTQESLEETTSEHVEDNINTVIVNEADLLFKLDEEKTAQYKKALEKEFSATTIHVDRSGYSPEVAEELGADYFGNQVIITSTEQKNVPLINEHVSTLDGLLKKIYDSAWTKTITPIEPITCAYGIGMADYTHDIPAELENFGIHDESYWVVAQKQTLATGGELSSPSQLPSRIQGTTSLVDQISGKKILKTKELTYLIQQVQQFKQKGIENIRELKTKKRDVSTFFVPSSANHVVKCTTNKHTVYLIAPTQNTKQEFIVYTGERVKSDTAVACYHLDDKEAIYDAFIEHGLVERSREAAHQRIEEIEAQELQRYGNEQIAHYTTELEKLKDTEKNKDRIQKAKDRIANGEKLVNGTCNLLAKYRALKQIGEQWTQTEQGKQWRALRDIIDEGNSPDWSKIPYELKLQFTTRKSVDPYINEILDVIL